MIFPRLEMHDKDLLAMQLSVEVKGIAEIF